MQIQRSVRTTAAPERVFDYMADFTTTNEWDPGTVKTTRTSGDGTVGTVYANTSRFMGRDSDLTYTVIEYDRPHLIRLRGENATVVADDLIEVKPDGAGSFVTYTATFTFSGVVRFVVPLLGSAFRRLGDDAEQGMRRAFASLDAR